jgi:hypothetical protein
MVFQQVFPTQAAGTIISGNEDAGRVPWEKKE